MVGFDIHKTVDCYYDGFRFRRVYVRRVYCGSMDGRILILDRSVDVDCVLRKKRRRVSGGTYTYVLGYLKSYR
jgi:hypothetical protein